MTEANSHSAEGLKRRIAESRDRLFRVALVWCGDETLADDLVRETMSLGIVNRQQLPEQDRLRPWLYGIMHNRWNLLARKGKPRGAPDERISGDGVEPPRAGQDTALASRVRHAAASLPGEQRQVISLVDLEGLSYDEVARILDIPLGTVMSRLQHARENLLAGLDGSGPGPTVPGRYMRSLE